MSKVKITGDANSISQITSDSIRELKLKGDSITSVFLASNANFQVLGPNGDCSDLVVTVISSTELQLDWVNGSTDETGISIEASYNNIDYSQIIEVSAGLNSYNVTGLNPSTLHYFKVRAVKDGVYSAYSNTASNTTS